jgi:hypothetical protein
MRVESLGELLRKKLERDALEALQKNQRENGAALAAKETAERVVRNFFTKAESQFAEEILDGRPIRPIKVGDSENIDVANVLRIYAGPQVTHPTHEYHALWVDFARWAESQDLNPRWATDHDGVGMRSWYLLTVVPV